MVRVEKRRHEVGRVTYRAMNEALACKSSTLLERSWHAHRVNDVLSLGSESNVHGIMSNAHHMYGAAVGRRSSLCLCQQTNARKDELLGKLRLCQ
jgi:hypothetical protein